MSTLSIPYAPSILLAPGSASTPPPPPPPVDHADGRMASQAKQVVDTDATARAPISLSEVLRVAMLQTRVDRKYLLTAQQFCMLADRLGEGFSALDIAGRRVQGYDSVYFDTPDLALFCAHRQGRRRRFKVRTRTYTDTAACMLEVKLQGPRGSTIKERVSHRSEHRSTLDRPALDFIDGVVGAYLGVAAPALTDVLTTSYQRATLVDPAAGDRLTLDVGLRFITVGLEVSGPDRVLVESKSATIGLADRILAAAGIRPLALSKYCVGLALTHPGLAANRWNRVLRRDFGWERRC